MGRHKERDELPEDDLFTTAERAMFYLGAAFFASLGVWAMALYIIKGW